MLTNMVACRECKAQRYNKSECSKSSTTYCGLKEVMQHTLMMFVLLKTQKEKRYKTYRDKKVKKIIFSDKVSSKKSQTVINTIYSAYLLAFKTRQGFVLQKQKDREMMIQQSKSQVKHTSWLDQLDHVNNQLFG